MNKDYAYQLLEKTRRNYNKIALDFSRARSKPWPGSEFLIENYLIPGDRVLDLGCGNGRYFELIKRREADYFGVDSSKELIKIAKEKYPGAKFKVNNALNLSFPSSFFNIVLNIAFLHHIPSYCLRMQVLKEAKRVLKPDGFLILTVWNLWQKKWLRKLIYNFGWKVVSRKSKLDFKDILIKWYNQEFYFHCFTQKELSRLVKKAGFKVIRQGKIVGGGNKKEGKWPSSNFYLVAKK